MLNPFLTVCIYAASLDWAIICGAAYMHICLYIGSAPPEQIPGSHWESRVLYEQSGHETHGRGHLVAVIAI